MRSPRNLVIVVLVAALIVYSLLPRTESWQEEVRLTGGKPLTIDRKVTYGGRSEIGQPTPVSKWSLKFTHPDSGERVTFEVQGGVELVLLDRHQNTLYLAGRVGRGDAYYALNCPNPPFLFYKYAQGWQQIPANEFPAGFTRANLPLHTVERDKLASAGKLISADQIREINTNRGLDPSATRIWNKPIAAGAGNSICGISPRPPRTRP